ncbi:MAG: hypothetical protein M0C28_47610 [Candidatus Moduliflexus flocculans]|nr:hypothetical protein [Candidatus Moduliflexus flocculans]
MIDLNEYGWDAALARRCSPGFAEQGLGPGPGRQTGPRSLDARGTADGRAATARSPGRFRHEAAGAADFPAVGDWAADPDGRRRRPGRSSRPLLPRRGAFTRKAAGEAVEAQVVAANVDTVFLVSGLDGDFNLRRIERYRRPRPGRAGPARSSC